ncbi:MAG: hypothetical protein AAGJ91_04880 [Pseudomonadota bacterium]
MRVWSDFQARAKTALSGVLRQTCAIAVLVPTSLAAQDQQPLSSIDWLSDSLAEEAALRPQRRAQDGSPRGVSVAPVTVTTLDVAAPDGAGLAGSGETGLAATLWGPTTTDAIARRLAAWPNESLPAARAALERLILARLNPPLDGGTPGALIVARIDTLLRLGALDQAAALLREAGTERPELFRRAFDVALLQGRENEGCAQLQASPGIAPSLPVRIFCLARSGDWSAAALTLETADALGQLSPLEDALLARFLEPEIAELAPPLPRISMPTPLEWRMLEAIGERQSTAGLPRAFAHADLRETAGWKSRIEATERLVRSGALPPERLNTVYRERSAAASGGVWDRVALVEDLRLALEADRPRAVARALPEAWAAMQAGGLAVPFAEALAPCLVPVALDGEAALLAHRIALLSERYEDAALTPPDGADALSLALARGLPPEPGSWDQRDPLAAALAAAFAPTPPAPTPRIAGLAETGRIGEALIEALLIAARGAEADPGDLAAALAFLRGAGMEETARRAALQIHLLRGRA